MVAILWACSHRQAGTNACLSRFMQLCDRNAMRKTERVRRAWLCITAVCALHDPPEIEWAACCRCCRAGSCWPGAAPAGSGGPASAAGVEEAGLDGLGR